MNLIPFQLPIGQKKKGKVRRKLETRVRNGTEKKSTTLKLATRPRSRDALVAFDVERQLDMRELSKYK